MELFPHNRRAYEEAVRLFEVGNRACVIQPTGTGKAVIIAEFINKHPGASHLLMAPGSHYFSEVCKHAGNKDLVCRTYQSVKTVDDARGLSGFDFIYMDEFHRLGAKGWGKMISMVISLNPEAKVLGTTATHIRYLDEQRDMAFELFKDSIASVITLHRAFLEGILKAPKYVTAIYSVEKEYEKMVTRIASTEGEDGRLRVSQLKRKMIDWELTSGIDVILKKHIPPDRKKILVFCDDLEDMKRAEGLIMPPLKEIFPSVRSLHIHSRYSEFHNRRCMNEFDRMDGETKVLFSRDKVNEGLHGRDISVAILLRKTTSPIVFYQQIGRCFSIGQEEQPIILDLVNNFESVQVEMFRADYEKEWNLFSSLGPVGRGLGGPAPIPKGSTIIEFIDETRGLMELMDCFANSTDTWEKFVVKASAFYEKHGHLQVPKATSLNLHKWIYRQRAAYKAKQLTTERVERLTAIGMDWERGIENQWMRKYEMLKQVLNANGGVLPGVIGDPELYNWLRHCRTLYADGRLPVSYVTLLEPLISLELPRERGWKEKLKLLREFKATHGRLPNSTKDPLYGEVNNVKSGYRLKTMPAGVLRGFIELGFVFKGNLTWDESFDLLKTFMKQRGRLPEASDDKKLWGWLDTQRKRHRNGKLKPEWTQRLVALGVLSVEGSRVDLSV